MDSIEPPSFSLGFDLDSPSEDPNSGLIGDDELEPGLTVPDSDPELEPDFSSPVLKRLRRGISNISKSSAKDDTNQLLDFKEDRDDDDDDDDIEEFSSPEETPASTRNHFSSSNSKVSLHAYGVLTNEKRKRFDVPPPSTGSVITSVAPLFQSSTRSPIRKLQLVDSDSEDDHPPSTANDSSSNSTRKEPGSGTMPCNGSLWNVLSTSENQTPAQRRFQLLDSDSEDDNDHPSTNRTNDSSSKEQPSVASKPKRRECIADLWKDFSPVKISKIQTPALDDVCEDYFSSIKTRSTSSIAAQRPKPNIAVASSSRNSGFYQQKTDQFLDLSLPSPPSHRFFLHSDPRIQNLARKRLPNFLPLGISNGVEVSLIDYMNQFGSKESSKTGDSSRRRGQTKSKAAAPKDVGKRRFSANSTGSAGHWFTSPEGKKVYISKSGQEFSGQSAYRCYKKETRAGFNKSRSKRKPKKKAKN